MVENIVSSVLGKLADEAFGKLSRIGGVGRQVEKLKRELRWIQAFLKDADRKTIRDEGQKHWVKEVRELAYDIEDVIDNALLLETEAPQESTSKVGAITRVLKKPRKVPALDRLADEIEVILERIEEISNSRIKYGIKDLGEGNEGDNLMLPLKPTMLPDIDDPNVIGFDTHRDHIVKELLDENTRRRSVVSIVGVGGLGKTTLARKAYNSADVKASFSRRLWVTVSQKFELIDILRKILEQIRNITSSEQGKETKYFLAELHKSFQEQKYLLVLDDVWTDELWGHIEEIMVDSNNGSRVLITSRNENVAKVADPSLKPYKLPLLSEDQGLQLLLQKAIRGRPYSNNLTDIATRLVKKCGGVPLALVVLGGLLSRKPIEYTEWNKLLQTMDWHTDGTRCMEILATSYDDLPLALKYCFMYFAAFPEDCKIRATELIRMWIAEGLISQEEHKTLEDTAEMFLEDLAQRSMVEVSMRSCDGSILLCDVHDLLRDLAIEKAKEDNFLRVCSKPSDEHGCGGARRMAIHHSDSNGLISYVSLNINLRSLLCFNGEFPNCSGHKLLKVLIWTSGKHTNKKIGDKNIEGLTQLKYLQLRSEYFVDTEIENPVQFIKLISSMKFLQTLNLRDIQNCDLSAFTWEIETLRHVMLLLTNRPSLGPQSGVNLKDLRTLIGIKTRESWNIATLPNLPNLRVLDITITDVFSWDIVVAFFGTLKNLISLSLVGNEIPIDVVDMRGFPFYQYLTSLTYKGKFADGAGVTLDSAMFPTHLTKLSFLNFRTQQVDLAVLEKLPHLKELYLWPDKIGEDIKQMRCSTRGFPNLETLNVWNFKNLEEWEIEEGAMPMLQQLGIHNCTKLGVPLGLKHLTKLRKLTWDHWSGRSQAAMAEEIRNLCGHVPELDIGLS